MRIILTFIKKSGVINNRRTPFPFLRKVAQGDGLFEFSAIFVPC
jgi:hypothetical protein